MGQTEPIFDAGDADVWILGHHAEAGNHASEVAEDDALAAEVDQPRDVLHKTQVNSSSPPSNVERAVFPEIFVFAQRHSQ